MNETIKITAWTRIESIKNEQGQIIDEKKSFNHISDGWDENNYPSPAKEEYTNQKKWKDMKWEKRYAYLENGKVVYV